MCVDWDRLTELRNDIGEEDFADVAILFVAELQDTLAGMEAATAAAEDFHFLRGSAANLGFTALVAACTRAEAAAQAGDQPDVGSVKAAFDQALAEMTAQMPDLAVAA